MSVDEAIRAAVVDALNSPEGRAALRRALDETRPAAEPDADRAYSVAEVAELSGYAVETILGHIASGALQATKPKGCREWRVRRADYRAWLEGGEPEEADSLDPDEVARKMLADSSGKSE